jgi:hypothetical protein
MKRRLTLLALLVLWGLAWSIILPHLCGGNPLL